MVYIYGLFDDSKNQLVYVGKTKFPSQRLQQHLFGRAREFRHHCRMEILESGEGLGTEDEYFWINYMRFIGCELVNVQLSPIYPVKSRAGSRRKKRAAQVTPLAAPPKPVIIEVFDRVMFIGYRVTKGISKKRLADSINVRWQLVSAWEKGELYPSDTNIKDIAVILDIPYLALKTQREIIPPDRVIILNDTLHGKNVVTTDTLWRQHDKRGNVQSRNLL